MPDRVAYEADGWGVGELWFDGDVVVHHELPRASGPPRASSHFEPSREIRADGIRERDESAPSRPVVDLVRAFFAGEPVSFDGVAIDAEPCTPFQRAVTAALRGVPYGEVVMYGELAALAGYPNAHRAVGTFCARNRFSLIVPCHRVVASAGLGPFGSLGNGYKRRLLELEGVAL